MNILQTIKSAWNGKASASAQQPADNFPQYASDLYQERAIPPQVSRWWQMMGIDMGHKNTDSLGKMGDNVWIYGAVRLISEEFARIEMFLEKEKNKEKVQLNSHQALETMNKPIKKGNGRAFLTGMKLRMITAQHVLLDGDAYWLMDKFLPTSLGGAPTMLYPLTPHAVRPIPAKDGTIKEYKYKTMTDEYTFPADSIVHFSLPDPEDPYVGLSAMRPARWATKTYQESDELNLARLINMAVPAGLLTSKDAVIEKERKKLLDQFTSKFAGSKNAAKTAFLPSGVQFQKVQDTNQEMQYREGKEFNRDEILASLRTPIELLGKTESQTRANAEVSNYVFQRFNILPFVELMADTLTFDYLPVFPMPDNDEWWFNFKNPVPEDREQERADNDLLMQHGSMTIDELRNRYGLQPLKIVGITDVPLIAINKIPAAMAAIGEVDNNSDDA